MVREDQTSDVQLHIGESRDSGFDAEPVIGPRFARTRWHRPGMTTRCPHSLFNILNTPLAMAIQRLSTVTSVVMKIRLRVERTRCGFDTRTSPILPGSTKCVSSCTDVSRRDRKSVV